MSSGTVTVDVAGDGREAVGVQEAGAGERRAGEQRRRGRGKVVAGASWRRPLCREFGPLTMIAPVWRSIVPLLVKADVAAERQSARCRRLCAACSRLVKVGAPLPSEVTRWSALGIPDCPASLMMGLVLRSVIGRVPRRRCRGCAVMSRSSSDSGSRSTRCRPTSMCGLAMTSTPPVRLMIEIRQAARWCRWPDAARPRPASLRRDEQRHRDRRDRRIRW